MTDGSAEDGPPAAHLAAEIDIADARRYADGIPWEDFRTLRQRPGLHWNPHEDHGFWAATRHADVCEVSPPP